MEINQTIIDALENIEAGDIEALRNLIKNLDVTDPIASSDAKTVLFPRSQAPAWERRIFKFI